MKFLCNWFGHKWYEQPVTYSDAVGKRPARTCLRCFKVQQQFRIVIPYHEHMCGPILVKRMGRDSLEWLDEPEANT